MSGAPLSKVGSIADASLVKLAATPLRRFRHAGQSDDNELKKILQARRAQVDLRGEAWSNVDEQSTNEVQRSKMGLAERPLASHRWPPSLPSPPEAHIVVTPTLCREDGGCASPVPPLLALSPCGVDDEAHGSPVPECLKVAEEAALTTPALARIPGAATEAQEPSNGEDTNARMRFAHENAQTLQTVDVEPSFCEEMRLQMSCAFPDVSSEIVLPSVTDEAVKRCMQDGLSEELSDRVFTRAYFFHLAGSPDRDKNFFEALRIELAMQKLTQCLSW